MTQTLLKNNTAQNTDNFFDDSEGSEQQVFLEEMGTLVFQSALMQQMTDMSEEEAKDFEGFINQNIGTDSFLEALCAEYPSFEKLLLEQMAELRGEIKEIIK